MTGPTPKRADSRSAFAAAITHPSPPNMYVRPIAPADSPRSRVANRISTAICMWCRNCHSADSHASANSVRLPHTSFSPSTISAVTDAFGPSCGTSFGACMRRSISADAKNATRVEQDRERRRQQLDQAAGHAGADQRGRRLAERDLRVRLDQPLAARELREQHLVRGAADDVLHAAEEPDAVEDLDRQVVGEGRDRNGEQRRAARDVGHDDDRQLAHAVEQHARVQRHERERQRLQRDEHAHLQRRGVQQQRRRQRQREVGDLGAERRDRQRDPELPEIRRAPEPA